MEERERSNSTGIPREDGIKDKKRHFPSSRELRVTFLASEWRSNDGSLSGIKRELAVNMAKDPKVEVTFFVPRCDARDKEAAKTQRIHLVEAEKLISCDELACLNFPPKNLLIDVVVGHGVELGLPAQVIRNSHQSSSRGKENV
ncbi:uncharacterized protein LOC111346356 [Stylophora pistillata]|uniref:uncharacterized protein LOC111346356 n=1 Tax=Stylophora pistillata TaxID=50429 RepID=UPI000C03B133|nr:uncharacterized protein LOC111346356 [Stylophora pistillata]